jgi:hypothetical protein
MLSLQNLPKIINNYHIILYYNYNHLSLLISLLTLHYVFHKKHKLELLSLFWFFLKQLSVRHSCKNLLLRSTDMVTCTAPAAPFSSFIFNLFQKQQRTFNIVGVNCRHEFQNFKTYNLSGIISQFCKKNCFAKKNKSNIHHYNEIELNS